MGKPLDTFETLTFYRGLSNASSVDFPVIYDTRKNRKPRNMPPEIHARADSWFEARFGVRYRSQSLFVTSSMVVAQNYACSPDHVVRIIPLGHYKYCWSPKRSDLLFYCASAEKLTIEEYLEQSEYVDTDLRSASFSGNEVMLYCEKYIAIPVRLLAETKQEKPQSSIILI